MKRRFALVALLAAAAAAPTAVPVASATAQAQRTRTVVLRSVPELVARGIASPGARPTSGPPRARLVRPMRWSYGSVVFRRPASTRYESGRAVVGVAPGVVAIALPDSLRVVSSDLTLHAIEVAGSPAALAGLEAQIGVDARIRYVEPLGQAHEMHQRNDPATYQVDPVTGRPYEWAFAHVGVDHALNVSPGSPSVLVGIIDTGFGDVPDLRGKVASAWYFDGEGTDASDTVGHGTFVASIITAANDDGYGLAGFCGACQVVPFKIVNLNTYAVAAAIHVLVDHGVRVINMSFGGPYASYVESDAVNYAISHNVLLVASSGNDGSSQVSYPAALLMGDNGAPGSGLAVGASDAADNRAFFSTWGSRLSLVAPAIFAGDCADGVYAALPATASEFTGGCVRLVTDPATGGRYAYATGTSFSAPEVAGVAALILAANPALTNAQVASIIEQSATRPAGSGWVPDKGWGVLNAASALEQATGRSSADTVALGSLQRVGRNTTGSHGSATAAFTYKDGAEVAGATASCALRIGSHVVPVAASIAGSLATCSWVIPANTAGESGRGVLTAADSAGNQASASFAIKVQPAAPFKPPAKKKKKRH